MSDTSVQVLLIDDDAHLRDLLGTFFQQRGIGFPVLHDANHPEHRLLRERPSVVLLDWMMPGIDGLWPHAEVHRSISPIGFERQ